MQHNLPDSYPGQSLRRGLYPLLTNSHTRCAVPDMSVESDSQLHIHHHMPTPRCQSWALVRVLWEVTLHGVVVMVLACMLRVLDRHLQDQTCCPESKGDSMDWLVCPQDRE